MAIRSKMDNTRSKMNGVKYFDEKVSPKLAQCSTAAEMLAVLEGHFKLDQKLGLVTSLAFRQGLRTAVTMINAQPK